MMTCRKIHFGGHIPPLTSFLLSVDMFPLVAIKTYCNKDVWCLSFVTGGTKQNQIPELILAAKLSCIWAVNCQEE